MDAQDQSSRQTKVGSSPSIVEVSPNDTEEEMEGETQGDNGGKRKLNVEGEENNSKRSKRSTSRVWEHFSKKHTKDRLKSICNHCKRIFVGESKSGSSHLLIHIDRRCPNHKGTQRDVKGMMGWQKALVGETVNGVQIMSVGNFEQEVSRDKLAKMVILHDFPLSIVDYVGFREFVFSLQPSFKRISINTLKSDIFKVYGIEKEKVVKLFSLCSGRVSLTTDMWTSKNKRRGFMVITAHFVDESWRLQSIILRFIYVPSPHTAAVLQEVLLDAMLEWNVDRRMGCLTVDNCSINDLMVSLLLDKLQLSTLLVRGEFFHMRCAAHIINLIVQDGLKVIEGCIKKVMDSVNFWIASPKRRQKFRDTADQIPVACTKELVLDCKTRSNSTYFMLSIALEYKDVFFLLRKREKYYVTLPTEEEWERAQEICVRLGLFYEVTCEFSGTNYATANVYFSKVCQMKIQMMEWLFSPLAYISEMARLMLDTFESYWSETHGIMGVESMLDPRFKMTFLNFMFAKIFGAEHAENQIKRVKSVCLDLMREYSTKKLASSSGSNKDKSNASQSNSIDPLDEYDMFVNSQSHKTEDVEMELNHYLEDHVLPRTSDLDVLFWWKTNGVKYPTLRALARDILAIPVSTVASESAFSIGKIILSDHRSRLNPKTLEALMCAQSWLWSQIKGKSTSPGDDIQSILDDDQDNDECESVVTTREELWFFPKKNEKNGFQVPVIILKNEEFPYFEFMNF